MLAAVQTPRLLMAADATAKGDGQVTRMYRGVGRTAALTLALLLLGCGQEPPKDRPLSYWADPKNVEGDECVAVTAQAIMKSGLPYPNRTIEVVTDSAGQTQERVKTVDVWVGPHRYLLPAKLVSDNGAYEKNHPRRFWNLGGSLPHFWPAGEPGPVVDGMGSMVDVSIKCSVDPAYVASYGKGYRSNAEGIEKVRQKYEEQLRVSTQYPGTVTVSVREDLQMTEVLLDRKEEANGRRFWEASYWPLDRELKGPSEGVSGIGCTIRHDVQKRYGGRGWRCTSAFRLSPQASVSIDIYVSQLPHMPSIFDQVRQVFESSKQN